MLSILRSVPPARAFVVFALTIGGLTPKAGIAQNLPSWAEHTSPPPIEKRSPQAQPSSETTGGMEGDFRSPPPTRQNRPSGRTRPEPPGELPLSERTGAHPRALQSSSCGQCPPNKPVCCRKNGEFRCFPNSNACGPGEEVPLSPTAAFLLSLFGAGYGAYRLREGSPEAAQ